MYSHYITGNIHPRPQCSYTGNWNAARRKSIHRVSPCVFWVIGTLCSSLRTLNSLFPLYSNKLHFHHECIVGTLKVQVAANIKHLPKKDLGKDY